MSTVAKNMVVGIFDDREKANAALTELRLAGFHDIDLGALTSFHRTLPHSPENPIPFVDDEKVEVTQEETTGALIGAAVGGLGALAVVTLALPGFGPVVAGGLFTLLALGAVGGAMAGGMIGSLTGIGVPEHHAQAIEQAMVAGCSVVSVHTTERHQEAAAILDRNGAHRMDADIDLPTVADT